MKKLGYFLVCFFFALSLLTISSGCKKKEVKEEGESKAPVEEVTPEEKATAPEEKATAPEEKATAPEE